MYVCIYLCMYILLLLLLLLLKTFTLIRKVGKKSKNER